MTDTEKITINLSVVDLGQIDLIVEQGFYSNRTDFIRTAIRNQLRTHAQAIEESITRRAIAMGVIVFDEGDLLNYRDRNEQVVIKVLGLLVLADDITPDTARQAIKSIQVFGVLRASPEVKEAIADRIL